MNLLFYATGLVTGASAAWIAMAWFRARPQRPIAATRRRPHSNQRLSIRHVPLARTEFDEGDTHQ